jgi:paraquat-inducible protein B
VTTRGVSGLQTVLAGVHIEGSWDQVQGDPAFDFIGADQAPAAQFGADGLRIVLRAEDGHQIAEGTPILFKGIEVGRVETPRLSATGDAGLFDAFIEAPHDRLVTTATRFWDASGFSFSLGAGGARVDIESLAALVGGGISFDTLVSGGRKPAQGHRFELFESEDDVRNNLFTSAAGRTIPYAIIFEDNVSGLTSGAPVEFRGIKIGEVTSLSAEFVEDGEDIADIRLIAKVGLNPKALGLPPRATEQITSVFLGSAVDAGLRARLTTASLLTGGLKIELMEMEGAPEASLSRGEDGVAILPSIPAEITGASASAEGMFRRINELPIEELIASTITLMNTFNSLANDPNLKNTPAEILGLVSDARSVVSSEQVEVVTASINDILKSLRSSAADLERVTSALSDEALVAQLRDTIQTAATVADTLKDASGGLPAIARQFEALAAKASDLPIEALIASTSDLVATVDQFASSDALKDIPPALTSALEEVRNLTVAIQSGDLIDNASATFASTQEASAKLTQALDNLPNLIAQMNRVARQAETTLSGFDEDSRFSASTRETLREIQQAAEAVSSLARAIERRPNSLLTGR